MSRLKRGQKHIKETFLVLQTKEQDMKQLLKL